MPPFGDGFKADGDMLPVPVCHGGFAVNGIVALGIICPPVRTPAFFSGEGTFQHGTAQKRKGARQFADFLNARFQCLCIPHDTECVQQDTIHLHLSVRGKFGQKGFFGTGHIGGTDCFPAGSFRSNLSSIDRTQKRISTQTVCAMVLSAAFTGSVQMLTGDDERIGKSVADELGLDAYYAQLLPDQKVEKLEMLDKQKRQGSKLAFVGDGINDAPVLARADVGIAMGGLGSDAAIEAADVVLMTDEPSKLVEAIDVAKATKRIVMQNIVIALGIKSVFLVLGALGMAGMWEAVFGDVGVTIIAVLNAMRILKK